MELNDIKQGYLDLVRAELSDYGVDQSKVTFSNQIELEGHIVDFGIFKSYTECLFDFPIKVYFLDDEKSIMFMPANREDYEKYRNDPELENSLDEIVKKAQERLNYLYTEYINEISEAVSDLTLEQRISEKMKENLQITQSLSDIKEWKSKIIIGNSIGGSGEDRLDVGDFDSVGYTWIGLTTGTIVPVARGDEHHRGGDLIHYLVSKDIIPQDSYYPIFFNHDYADSEDPKALQAFKVWRKLGGPNIILNRESHKGDPFHITMDDYISLNGKIEINKGELLPIGKTLIEMLTKVSTLCIDARQDERKEKRLYTESLRTYKFFLEKVNRYSTDAEKSVLTDIMKAESLGGEEGIKKLEQLFFGFDGFKNKLHNEIRKAMSSTYDFQRKDMLGIFGDLELANHLFGSL